MFSTHTATTNIYTYRHTLTLHDAPPIKSEDHRTSSRAIRAHGDMRDIREWPPIRTAPDRRRSTVAPSRSGRSEEHTSELQSLMRISYAVLCSTKKKKLIRLYITCILLK